MSKRILLAVAVTLYITVCSAQPAGPGWKFRSDNYLGLASGEWGNSGLVQTVNGISKGPWFLGLGAGLDNYRFRSVPLFVSVTRDWRRFFLHLDGGTNLPWYKRTIYPNPVNGGATSSFHPGLWWSAGLGYKWKLSAHTDKALLFSADYSVKKLTEDQTSTSICYALACQFTPETYVYKYLNQVLLFKIGFMF